MQTSFPASRVLRKWRLNVKEFIHLNSFVLDTRENPLYTPRQNNLFSTTRINPGKPGGGIRIGKIKISLRLDCCRRRDDRGHGGTGAGTFRLYRHSAGHEGWFGP